ncbi:FHA domain-containing protein [Spirochaeta cellobiosiphila]|uniref:FHA domain-containing protein n=1 Tax=Spirochaeta cellobiosiphila TaxID=504483 RepID=UPI0003FB4487|nr:FHA domain-containing protein [Spirochaeta cellobiosiphila]
MSTFIKRLLIVIVGILAGVAVWPLMEITISFQRAFPSYLISILVQGLLIGAVMGAFLGSAEGLLTKNSNKTSTGAIIGGTIGGIGGILGFFLAQNLILFVGNLHIMDESLLKTFGWIILGMFIAIGEGIRSRSIKKILIGLGGGIIGGCVGGLFIEKSAEIAPHFIYSRLFGLIIFSGTIALAYSLLESGVTYGVIRVLNGKFKGKQFPLVRSKSLIGASRKVDISLSGYTGLAQEHGVIQKKGKKLYLLSLTKTHPLLLNEHPVKEQELKWEDVIQAGDLKLLLTSLGGQ